MKVTTWEAGHRVSTTADTATIDMGDGRVIKIQDGIITVETATDSFDFSEPCSDGLVRVFHGNDLIAGARAEN